jgi:hypothetical protein
LIRGSGKMGKGAPGARNSKCPGSVALAVLNREVGCLNREYE